jgi:NADH dehydrogenase
VLVTGANGQLGRRLIKRLAAHDPPIAVRAVVRSQSAADSLRDLAVDVRVLDYADESAMNDAAIGCTHVVHLVGIIKEGARSRYVDAHERSTEVVCAAAAHAGARRIVYLSILGTDPDSANACLASKGRAERIVLDAKTPGLVLRVPMVLGPGDFTAGMIRREALAGVLPLPGGGATRTQPIFADDVVAAILAGVTGDDLDDVALDLAGPESLSQRELIERAARLYDRRPRVVGVPLGFMKAAASLAERLMSDPPFTRTSVEVINEEDDVDPEPARARLGITLTSVDEMLRRCVGPEAGS